MLHSFEVEYGWEASTMRKSIETKPDEFGFPEIDVQIFSLGPVNEMGISLANTVLSSYDGFFKQGIKQFMSSEYFKIFVLE